MAGNFLKYSATDASFGSKNSNDIPVDVHELFPRNDNGLHPSLKGYEVWAEGLTPILIKLLGPPAATDHAPQPTGDPSASERSGR
jgi:lysophospholipase L1-like esterase